MSDRGRSMRRQARPARCVAQQAAGQLVIGSLVADPNSRQAYRDGRRLRLQRRHFDLLLYLMRHADVVVTRETLAKHVWRDETAIWTNVITVCVHGLRKELERDGYPTILHTVRGSGYRLGESVDGEP